MATAYGEWISGDDWRAVVTATVDYSQSADKSKARITVTGKLENVYAISGQANWVGVVSSGASSTNSTSFGNFGQNQTVTIRTNAFDVSRSTSGSTTVTVRCAVTSPSGSSYGTQTSTATLTLTVSARPTYTIAYNANGGTGAPASQTKVYGQSLTLSSTRPTREGYTFGSSSGYWHATGDDTSWYDPGGTFTKNVSTTLYAAWTPKTYTVTYSANGGSSTPSSQTKTHGTALTLRGAISRSSSSTSYTVTFNANSGSVSPSSRTATRTTTYTFSKWKATNGTTYSAGGSYTTNAATTMTAQWTTSASTTSVTLPTPTRSGYTFDGWYTASSGGTRVGGGGGSYTPSASVTLYAHWTATSTYTAFKLGTITAKRCTQGGTLSDDGTYCSATLSWTAGTSAVTSVTFKAVGGGSTYTGTGTISGTTATCTFGGGNLGTDTRYTITATATDGTTTLSKQTVLSPSFYTLDFLSGGRGVAFGQAATQAGFWVNMVPRFLGGLRTIASSFTRDTVVPESTAGDGLTLRDSADTLIGSLVPYFSPDGREGIRLGANRSVSGSTVNNYLWMQIDASGNQTVTVTSGTGAVWRNAFGASNGIWPLAQGGTGQSAVTTTTTVNDIVSAQTNVTVSSASFAQWGKLAMVTVAYTLNNAVSVPTTGNTTNTALFTLASGKRPAVAMNAMLDNGDFAMLGDVSTGGVVTLRGANARSAAYSLDTSTTRYMRMTYLLA